ncbi:Glutamate or tyrosine decarboxylase or a related PLP-dependent protein [Geosmithia morbida]|uniref:Glutamate or tyrosine decarboxylase or a related PLP-dependent protein n=1 Tax=Geosmithia morbida TaxID=1094350 RepID=A0A9P4YYF0_9HYPO|nr:Glutamate or tyrosine decarboxylase or a related PLP-dependent protein [Geosmithia morbida]KAF4124797.1 Glutamate or tyrosine decarboxylase or a related PLP-dependent protein [Geosmithia morbida]
MPTELPEEYSAIHSYFIGPKGANLPDFRANINTVLDELLEARQNYYPSDQRFITKEVRRSKKFLEVRDNLRLATQKVAQLLGEHSAPFWSPRYEAHMCTDLTMSSLLGYFMTMLYNPNNVALEASPMTTLVELRVGKQLCKLFGYKVDERKAPFKEEAPQPPVAWGHITCDGTIANLESIWVARNLKFYPLSLFQAVTKGKLAFIANDFTVKPCRKDEPEKLFKDMTPWELLNLRPETVLDMPTTLYNRYGITSEFLESVLRDYNIQTVGRNELEDAFSIKDSMKYFVGKTRHYSWPKGAAIAGLGSKNMVGVDIDVSARVDIPSLKRNLLECFEKKTAVYAVVAVIGSTEEGAVDRLSEIVNLRATLQDEYGLSFLIHADAAWGGYFATMLSRNRPHNSDPDAGSTNKPDPEFHLDPDTREDLRALENADSITVDPHKAGYIPYPAGSLVYRDGRMRYLVTWSSPYLSQGSAENIGVYGVEGSKPGAAAMSAWFSNQTIGLHNRGYGMLLGEATFTSARLSAYYATMVTDDFICVPLNMLRSEEQGKNGYLSDTVEKERRKIRELIIGKDDSKIFKSPEAMEIISRLGSDTNINAFALNWKHEDKTLNTDLEEANYFMKNIVDRLSITSGDTDPTKIPIFLTSTQFSHDDYGKCVDAFIERIGVTKTNQSLFVLRNVVMSPFPTHKNFLSELMVDLQKVIREEVEVCRKRNARGKKQEIQFLVQGSSAEPTVFLAFQTSFHSATRRQQIVFSATLDRTLQSAYESLREADGDKLAILRSTEKHSIEEVVNSVGNNSASFQAIIKEGTHGEIDRATTNPGTVTLKSVVKSRPLNSVNQDDKYPSDMMPFYLYGTPENMHVSHVLVYAPNIDLSASNLVFSPGLPARATALLSEGLILGITNISEEAVQPFPSKNTSLPEEFFFRKGRTFNVKVWKDPKDPKAKGPGLLKHLGNPLYTGKMTLGRHVVVDAEGPNEDPFKHKKETESTWQNQLDTIGGMLDGTSGIRR